MKAMILAAGRGTRLAPLTDHTPKPLLPLRGKPLIQWQLEALAAAGIRECIINLHHLSEQIEAHLGDGRRLGVTITYSRETELLDTGGGVVKALPFFAGDPFLLLNGDIWTDFDFAGLPPAPPPGCGLHMVLAPTPAHRAAGDFSYAHGRVTGRGHEYVFCGIAVMSPSLLHGRRVEAFSLRDVYFEQAAAGTLSAQIHPGVWHDIGTLDQYQALSQASGDAGTMGPAW